MKSSSWKGSGGNWDNSLLINNLADEPRDGISLLKGILKGYFK